MYLIWLIPIIILKILLCKGFILGIVLLLFFIKVKQLRYNSHEWDHYFISLSVQTVQKCMIMIYLIAALTSSAISYFILKLASCQYSLEIAILIFMSGLLMTAYKYAKGKDELIKKYQEISRKILKEG
ncbi:MAG: hypothetical protein KHZ15_02775 [Coprobacillus cateniformis]|uniref:hypothetical protein n=1 Tax=Longibaculum muris TaxID=1796628 RepID=UPI003AB3F83D|nr:hypothetical protein [Coprobacillus cateniformis]